jgi:hypothetical protein
VSGHWPPSHRRTLRSAGRVLRFQNSSGVYFWECGSRAAPQRKRSAVRAAQGAPATGRSRTAPGRRPFTGRAKHCLCWIQGPGGPGLRFSLKQFLKLALRRIVAWPLTGPRSCPGHLLALVMGFGGFGTAPIAHGESTAVTFTLPPLAPGITRHRVRGWGPLRSPSAYAITVTLS